MKRRDFLKGAAVGVVGGLIASDLSDKEGMIRGGGEYLTSRLNRFLETRRAEHELQIAQELHNMSDLGIGVDLKKYGVIESYIGPRDSMLILVENFNRQAQRSGARHPDEIREGYFRKVMMMNGVEIGENERIQEDHYGMLGDRITGRDHMVFLYGGAEGDGDCLPQNIGLKLYMLNRRK